MKLNFVDQQCAVVLDQLPIAFLEQALKCVEAYKKQTLSVLNVYRWKPSYP